MKHDALNERKLSKFYPELQCFGPCVTPLFSYFLYFHIKSVNILKFPFICKVPGQSFESTIESIYFRNSRKNVRSFPEFSRVFLGCPGKSWNVRGIARKRGGLHKARQHCIIALDKMKISSFL